MTDGSKTETIFFDGHWTDEDLRNYFLSVSYISPLKDFSYEESRFPGKIDLNQSWHEALELMRDQTAKDDHERFSFVAVSKKDKKVMVLGDFMVAEKANEPIRLSEVTAALQRAEEKGLQVVAWIHSHPPGLDAWEYDENELGKHADKQSVGDLWWLVRDGDFPQAMILVGTTKNQIIFKTKDCLEADETTQDEFMLSPKYKNYRDISQKHHLVVYEGEPNKALERKRL